MASNVSATPSAEQWLEEENLMLLECWARDGYTFEDVANKIGISRATLTSWRSRYPEIESALKAGREIVDYKVENALLKSALGYRTKEVKIITTMRYGKVVETVKEVLEREQAPNVSAAQCWLYNRLPKKWKNMNSRANILEDIDEDTSIQVTVTRASKNSNQEKAAQHSNSGNETDDEWVDEINESIEIRQMTEEEQKEAKKAKEKNNSANDSTTKVLSEPEDDPDYWPDDWEDEDWEE